MVALPAEVTMPTIEAIYRVYVERNENRKSRRLGASILGKECDRMLWQSFRWVASKQFQGRMLRLFQTGHLEEPRMVGDLRGIGVEVHEIDAETGEQFTVTAIDGHLVAKLDGVGLGLPEAPKTWHVLEFKTHSAKSFGGLLKDGLLKSKPEHYTQVQIEMLLTGMTRAFYLAKNKDTDELWSARVEFDKKFAERAMARAERIIFAPRPPSKIHHDPAWWQCKFCDFHANCHEGKMPEKNCRTCMHSSPNSDGDGAWECSARYGEGIPFDVQLVGCPEHLFHPDLIDGEPIESSDHHVTYAMKDGSEFTNGNPDAAQS